MLLVALAVPGAFGADAVLFGVRVPRRARCCTSSSTRSRASGDPDLLGAVVRIVPTGAARRRAADRRPASSTARRRSALWVVALAIDYVGALIGHVQGWRVSPAHFAERHGLIVIIALGESIVSIGVGARAATLDAGVVAAAVLGIVVARRPLVGVLRRRTRSSRSAS